MFVGLFLSTWNHRKHLNPNLDLFLSPVFWCANKGCLAKYSPRHLPERQPATVEKVFFHPKEPIMPLPHGRHPGKKHLADMVRLHWLSDFWHLESFPTKFGIHFSGMRTYSHNKISFRNFASHSPKGSSSLRPNLRATLHSSVWEWRCPCERRKQRGPKCNSD